MNSTPSAHLSVHIHTYILDIEMILKLTIKQYLLNSKLPNAATAHMVESFNSCIGNKQKPYAYTITFDYTVVEYTYYEMSIIILTMTQKER